MPRQRRWLFGTGGGIAIALLGVFAFWFVVIRGDAPPPVSLEGAVESLSTPAATAAGASPASPEPTQLAAASLDGTWTVSTLGESFVGYRVRQVVAGVDAPTRVGRTPAVTATLAVEGGTVSSLGLEADLLQLTSGDERRDAVFADLLETERFPLASFVLSSPVAIDDLVDAAGEVALGASLTLHGETHEVTLTLQGRTADGLVVLVGSTEILFSDFGIDRPTALAVLSIEERAELELQIVLARP